MELLATTRGQDDDLHTYVVAESARRGDASALRTLLEQDSAHANRVDATGSSALMHASEAGQAECCSVLLAGGADPHLQRTSDGATALGLAAANGKPGSIHALLQHDPGLVNSTDGSGRTALHHAVAAGSFNTAKYLLGRWGADDALPDAQGDTPLHLCATRALLLLLAHGPPNRPLARLGKLTNRSGQTPVDAWEAAGCAEIVQAARTRGSWLYDPHPQELAPTVSFLRHSPSRVPPRARPPPAWPRRLLCVHLGIVWLPFCVLAFGCFTPLLGPRVWLGFWAWILLGAGGCCLAVPPRDWVTFFNLPTSLPIAALLLVTPIAQVIVTHHAFILVPLLGSRPLLGLATLSAEAMVYRSYWQLLRADAGFVPGGTAEAARLYWASLERPPAGGAAAAAGAEPGEGGFDHRSETVVPPRARYSPMAGGLILGMDHDCPWVGGPVGRGNHRPFIGLLLFGDAALLLHVACVCTTQPLGVADPNWHRPLSLLAGEFKLWDRGGLDLAVGRLLLLSEALALLLVLLISTLLYAQLRLICANVLTVEQIRWHRQHPGESAPSRGQPGWSEYAPYDLGSNWRCLVGFARGERGCDGAGLVRAAAEAGSSRVEKAV